MISAGGNGVGFWVVGPLSSAERAFQPTLNNHMQLAHPAARCLAQLPHGQLLTWQASQESTSSWAAVSRVSHASTRASRGLTKGLARMDSVLTMWSSSRACPVSHASSKGSAADGGAWGVRSRGHAPQSQQGTFGWAALA